MTGQDFKQITIRGRVAFAICCLENAIEFNNFQKLDWSLLLDFLWKFPTGNEIRDLAEWHENEAECIAFCIMDVLTYDQTGFDFITKDQYDVFEALYKNSNKTIWELTNYIAAIGTHYLYSGVRDGAPQTLNELDKVINLLIDDKIPLPSFSDFKKFSYPINPETDWIVWGEKIEPASLKGVSRYINTANIQ